MASKHRDANGESENSNIETPIYAHMASDGLPYCSYGVNYTVVNGCGVDLERVECAFYEAEGSDEVIGKLTVEGMRGDADPPRIGTLTFNKNGIENIEISLPDVENEYILDSDGWPDQTSDIPVGLSEIDAVFTLSDDAIVYECGEGPVRITQMGARRWFGPSVQYDPSGNGEPVATYKVETPSGDVLVRESDIEQIQTQD